MEKDAAVPAEEVEGKEPEDGPGNNNDITTELEGITSGDNDNEDAGLFAEEEETSLEGISGGGSLADNTTPDDDVEEDIVGDSEIGQDSTLKSPAAAGTSQEEEEEEEEEVVQDHVEQPEESEEILTNDTVSNDNNSRESGNDVTGENEDDIVICENERTDVSDAGGEQSPASPMETEDVAFNDENSETTSADAEKENENTGKDKDEDDVEIIGEETSGDGDKSKAPEEVGVVELQSDEKLDSEEEDVGMPMIRVKQVGLFAEEEEDEDDQIGIVDPDDIQNMMQVEMAEGVGETSTSARPRRAAAAAAANVIREISSMESNIRKSIDKNSEDVISTDGGTQESQRCHVCKKVGVTKVTVRQYGQDIHFCTTSCFNVFRNPDASRRALPCAKCGIIQRDNVLTSCYYWETMNFCSDLCVGNFQMEIGSRCATCSKKVGWTSLGKYCVRFGSDVRQFCSAFCLETYKKNARVCFHCQLDIKKLTNVILANIPAKTTPKEFCSQDCVEMYIEQNLHQTVRHKPNQNCVCIICSTSKNTFRELVLPVGNFKVCSESCWIKLLEAKSIRRPVKCEICSKYVDLNYGSDPKLYVSTHKKVYGFCSATCKNVFVLRSRQILACTTCKVKKYNYDLIEHIDEGGISAFAVCSLNCIPKPSQYIINLRETLTPASTASEMVSKARLQQDRQQSPSTSAPSRIRTTIVSNDGSSSTEAISEKSITDLQGREIRIVSAATLSSNGTTSTTATTTDVECNNDSAPATILRFDYNPEDTNTEVVEVGEVVGDLEGKTVSVTEEEMAEIMASVESCIVFPPKEPKEQRNKGCLVRPFTTSVSVQVDGSTECSKDCSKNCEKVKEKYVPIFIPVYVPFPFYALESPAPIPLPVPLPIPIPIPIVLPSDPHSSGRTLPPLVAPVVPDAAFVTGAQQLQPQQPNSLENPSVLPGPGAQMPEPMSMDPVGTFLDLTEPSVGESDSYDILNTINTIPTFEMDLGLGSTHHAPPVNEMMSAGSMLNSGTVLPPTSCPMMGNVVPDPTPNLHWSQPIQQPVQQPTVLRNINAVPSHPGLTRESFALRVWQDFFGREADPLILTDKALCDKLKELVEKGSHPTGERFRPSLIIYLCLGLQQYLRNHQRNARIFYHSAFEDFIQAFVSYTEFSYQQGIVEPVVDEIHFWESFELGVNSPEALMFTLVYYNYKYFNLRTWQDHESLTFNHLVVRAKVGQNNQRYKYLSLGDGYSSAPAIEVLEMEPTNKCFVKLFEFYKYKCVSSTGPFYKAFIPQPPSKGKWYSAEPLSQMEIYRMLIRAMMIKG